MRQRHATSGHALPPAKTRHTCTRERQASANYTVDSSKKILGNLLSPQKGTGGWKVSQQSDAALAARNST